MKRIIHLEDAEMVYKQVKDALDDWFGTENVSIENLDFEKAAANFIDRNESKDIVAIIVDLMITYHSDERLKIPKEILLQGSFDAGFRLIRMLQTSPVWQDIPIIIFSSVEKGAVEERLEELGLTDVTVCQKTFTLDPLMTEIRKITGLEKLER